MRDPAYYIGKPVESLQTMLRVVAKQDGTLPKPIPDGVYGAETMRAVTAFQRSSGLPPTGVTDLTTWAAVREAYRAARIEAAPAAPLWIALSPQQRIEPGSDCLYMTLIQAMLHTVAIVYGNLPDCTLCGICDEQTVQAVKGIQELCGMPQTGCIDKAFWRHLVGLYTHAVLSGTQSEVSVSAPTEPPQPPAAAHAEKSLYF